MMITVFFWFCLFSGITLLLFAFDLLQTFCADILSANCDNIFCVAAENASRLILFQHDVVAVDEDFDRIFMTNVECSAKFDGKNNSSELIDLSHDSRSLHRVSPFLNVPQVMKIVFL